MVLPPRRSTTGHLLLVCGVAIPMVRHLCNGPVDFLQIAASEFDGASAPFLLPRLHY
jgi:hypothetical protein